MPRSEGAINVATSTTSALLLANSITTHAPFVSTFHPLLVGGNHLGSLTVLMSALERLAPVIYFNSPTGTEPTSVLPPHPFSHSRYA